MDSVRTRVVAAVIARDGRFLLCQRPMEKRHGGLWEFPGGKREAGETDLVTAKRELREELGLGVTGVGAALFEIADPGSSYLIAFVPVWTDGEPIAHEHLEIRWVSRDELIELDLAPSDRAFVEAWSSPGVF